MPRIKKPPPYFMKHLVDRFREGPIRGNRLEALKRDRAGQHSIRINDRWRICFSWREGNPHDVEIVDYH
jgi:plasmid maintenance system killer protein